MRRNRKVSKRMSRISVHTMHIGAVMLMLFVMVILNLLASSSCNQLVKIVDQKDKELKSCNEELERTSARWDAMRSSDNLDRALVKRGISMHIPNPNQIILMDASGHPQPGQTSVALLRQRVQGGISAQVSVPAGGAARRRR